MDRELMEEKLESLRRCVKRIESRCPSTLSELEKDLDAQDIITLNLTRAVQLAIDMAAHVLSEKSSPAPQTMGEAFEQLADLRVIDEELCQRMKAAVGFRNMAVHSYADLSWSVVLSICQNHLVDFRHFAKAMVCHLES